MGRGRFVRDVLVCPCWFGVLASAALGEGGRPARGGSPGGGFAAACELGAATVIDRDHACGELAALYRGRP